MRHAVLPALCVLPLLLAASSGCAKSPSLVARNAFASSYWCPVNQIEVRAEPGSAGLYRVTGCGLVVDYDCSGTADSTDCHARVRVEYEATDGTSHGAWLQQEASSNNATAREAAVASAAHDLSCAPGSLQVVASDQNGFPNVVDGCGQRVTYQVADAAEQPTATPSEPVKKHKYVVLSRQSFAAPSAPSVPPPAASAAPAPAPPHAASATPPPVPAPSASTGPAPTPSPSASPLSTPR